MNHRLPKYDVVLLGAGHTNSHVIRMWRMEAPPDARLTCISNFSVATYSGMLPGTLAGFYEPWQMQIDLVRLCASVGARLIVSQRVENVDLERREILFADRPPVHFDVLSIGIGSVPRPVVVEAGKEGRHAVEGRQSVGTSERSNDQVPKESASLIVPIKPMQTFLQRLDARLQAIAPRAKQRPLRIAVIGAGAAGVEIAFCLPGRVLSVLGDVPYELSLIDRRNAVAHGLELRAAELVRRELVRRGVRLWLGREVRAVDEAGLVLDGDELVPVDLALAATSATAPPLLRRLGLPTDDDGFLLVRSTLRTVADAPVFVVGDSGVDPTHPHPKAGVYAVRQGPILWENIRRMLRGETLKEYVPQKRFLKLLCTGDGRAILSYNGWAAHRAWCWRLKDWIDRRFMAKYQRYESPATMKGMRNAKDGSRHDEPQIRCAGCGGKLGGTVLRRVLEQVDVPDNERVIAGLSLPDDVAAVRMKGGHTVVATADFFAAFLDDPYLVGRIAALNAASDLFASGAKPLAAMALATIPEGPPAQQERLLSELLIGGVQELEAMGATLVGGHTVEGPQLTIGYSLLGEMDDAPCWKRGLRVGDWLVLTKPLGIGVLLAAHMQARCQAIWFELLIETMLRSNQPPPGFFSEHEILGVTDVTGFGLAGHLLEMLRASGMSAEIWLNRLPVLPGALQLVEEGLESTLASANRQESTSIVASPTIQQHRVYPLLFDPQTSGGLLFGVPETHVSQAIDRLRKHSGVWPALIGRVTKVDRERPRLYVSEVPPSNVPGLVE